MNFITCIVPLAFMVLSLAVCPAFAQNTILTTSGSLPGGGTGVLNVVVGPGNNYPAANYSSLNVFVGSDAGKDATTGDNNTFVGTSAGKKTTAGEENVFLGSYAGFSNTTGNANDFTGYQAGYFNTAGYQNSFTGYRAGYSNTTGKGNSFTGYNAGYNNTAGNHNIFAGHQAGYSNTIGGVNVFTGYLAGYNNTTGGVNVFTGYQAGYRNTTGTRNTFTGPHAGDNNTTGERNVFTGYSAGYSNTTGYNNTFLGANSNATGSDENNLRYATALGYNAMVGVNNGLVLGDTMIVKVGIGTAYPDQKLTIRGNMNFVAYDNSLRLKNQPFLHFNEHESLALGLGAEIPDGAESTLVLGSENTQLKVPGQADVYALTLSAFAGQEQSGQYLSVDHEGRVVLTRSRVQVANVADWADKVFKPDYALRPLGEVEAYVKKHQHLPGVPSADEMVNEGIDLTKIIAKQMEKIEELTLYLVELEKKNVAQEEQIEDTQSGMELLKVQIAELKDLIRQIR